MPELSPPGKLYQDLRRTYEKSSQELTIQIHQPVEGSIPFRYQRQAVVLQAADELYISDLSSHEDDIFLIGVQMYKNGQSYIHIQDDSLKSNSSRPDWYLAMIGPELPPFMVNTFYYYNLHKYLGAEVLHLNLRQKIAAVRRWDWHIALSDQDCLNLSRSLAKLEVNYWGSKFTRALKTPEVKGLGL